MNEIAVTVTMDIDAWRDLLAAAHAGKTHAYTDHERLNGALRRVESAVYSAENGTG